MVASVSRKNRFKKTFVGGQFPRSKGRHAKWNRFHRFSRIVKKEEEEEESVSFPRFAGLARDAVDGIEKKVRRSLSRVRPNDYGRGSNFASCRLHHPVRCSRYRVFRPRIRRTRRVYVYLQRHSKPPRGEAWSSREIVYALRNGRIARERQRNTFVKTGRNGFPSFSSDPNTKSFPSTRQSLETD